jgi:hypothetical protein
MTYNLQFARYNRRKKKYGNKTQVYNGKCYDSIKEANYAEDLDWRLKAKDIKAWDRQVKISLDVNGEHITNYFVDFKIIHNDNSIEYVEVKGFATALWQLKWLLFEALINEIDPNAVLTVYK